jgi:hypothetical protein
MICGERGNTSTAVCILLLMALIIGCFTAVVALVDHNTATTRIFYLND